MWWYLWKQKPIGPINLSVSTHLISSPKQKKMIKQNKKKELKKKHHPFKNTTKYYYYIYLYDKTENYNYDISIYILWFMFRSIEKKKKENYCLKQIGNVVWTFRWFFFFPFQVYRVTVVDSAHHLLDQVLKNAYTVHKMKFRYVIVWNSIKFVSKKKKEKGYSISKHILRAFELPSISCHRYYDKLANKNKNKKPYHHKVT